MKASLKHAILLSYTILCLSLALSLYGLSVFLPGQYRACAAANTITYAESEAESSTRATSYQDKVALTFTPEFEGPYLILCTAELKGSSSSYSVLARLTIDGVSSADLTFEPEETGIYVTCFATHKITNLAATSHTIKIQYRSESTSAYAYVRRARILAIPLHIYESQESTAAQTISTTYSNYQDIVAKSFTVDAGGDYLLLSSAEFNALSTSQSVRVRTLIDGTNLGETISEAKDTTDYLDYFIVGFQNLSAGTHTLKIQASNSSTTKHRVRNARVTAIPLQANGMQCHYNSSEGYITNGGTTPLDITSIQFTPEAQEELYFLTSAIVGGNETNGSAYNGYFDFTADGTTIAFEQKGFKDNTDRLPFAAIKKLNLTTESHTCKLRAWSGASANPDAGMGNARIIVLSQTPMAPLPGVSASW